MTASSGRVKVGAIEIAYDARGEGEPILLIPGFTMRRTFWPDALVEILVSQGFRVIRMDNRDSGESSRIDAKPPNGLVALRRSLLGLPIETPYRLEDMAADAFGLMSALGYSKFHVAGASMGGMIAQTMAIVDPSRLLTLSSVMSNPGGRRYAFGKPAAMKALLTPPPREKAAHIEHMIGTLRTLHGDALPFDEAEAREFAELQVDGGSSPSAAARHFGAILESSGRRLPLIRGIKVPTLIVHGAVDPLLRLRGARAMARMIEGAELVVVEGMGHAFPASAVPVVARAIAKHARRKPMNHAVTRPSLDLPRAARALKALLANPDDLPQVFNLLESLSSTGHAKRLRSRFDASGAGRRLLRDKPDIVTILGDRARLRAMPAGSLGRAYLSFVENEGISAQGIRDAAEVQGPSDPLDSDLIYVRERMRDTHDLWHAATGYHGDVLGEVGLLAFIFAQTQNIGIAVIVAAAIAKGFGKTSIVPLVRDGFRRGRRATWLPSVEWEALLEKQVEDVRAILHLESPPVYEPLRTSELRMQGLVA